MNLEDPFFHPERRKINVQDFGLKDSGKRKEFDGGMVRDTDEGKVMYDLVFDGPMLERWAEHLTKGAKKYSPRNWMLGTGNDARERGRASAVRHFFQWLRGDKDEDHAAAVFFNLNLVERIDSMPAVEARGTATPAKRGFERTLYLSGKMSGEADFGSAYFAKYAEHYRGLGYKVISPPELDNGDNEKPYSFYVERDIQVLTSGEVDVIVMLPNWKDSKGACWERFIAERLGIEVWEAYDLELKGAQPNVFRD